MKEHTHLYMAVLAGDHRIAARLVRDGLAAGAKPRDLLNGQMIPAMRELGTRFEKHEIVIPDMLLGARAMQAGLDLIEPLLAQQERAERIRVSIGTVQGDHHDIGKRIVAMMVRAAGYEVEDLGVDCDAGVFEQAAKRGSRAVLCSALVTRAAAYCRIVADALSAHRDAHLVIGGAGASRALADEIGAHGYGADADEAVAVLNRLFGRA